MKRRRGTEGDATSGLVYVERQLARASARLRLRAAREQLWLAKNRQADARGTPAESRALLRVGEAAAEVATREQWLHWTERGTSLQPEADGVWGRPAENQRARDQRSVERRPATPAACRAPQGASGPRARLRSAR
jgi:hypothetical protein